MTPTLIQKCWEVHDRTTVDWSLSYEARQHYTYREHILAETASKAKGKFIEHARFIDLKAVRCEEYDQVEVDGKKMRRNEVDNYLRKQERKKKIQELPEDQLYYVQNGFVGNCPLFWGLGNCGYTSDLDKAQKYTKEQIVKEFSNPREQDIIWLAAEVDSKVKRIVDHQYLDYTKSV
jgi:hypothetical protein